MRRYCLPLAIGALLLAFWLSPDSREIAAGVAIFLFGVLMLEDGFKLFGGGLLEGALERVTGSTSRSLLFGIVSTTLLQSSSLVSIITVSFLSAGLISLAGGIGIVLGANIGTTTGAWLVAGPGLKVDIAAFAMPMIALGVVLVFQRPKALRGAGYALGGLGFLFLGIHHMKEGFEAFGGQIDLTRYALPGLAGLGVYTLLGSLATVLMQSSHATMVLVLTALAAAQITYDNALALAIGANVGTTVSALVASLGANFQGRRLALAHLIFNAATAAVALAFVAPLRELVDRAGTAVGIAADDFALRLALFHTVFNVLGVALTLPLLGRLVAFLERRVVERAPDVSRPRYLNEAVDEFPQTLESALRKEVAHLHENAVELILHGLNLHRDDVFGTGRIVDTVRRSRTPIELDIDERYERRVKTLYSAIVDYSSRAGDKYPEPTTAERIHALREAAGGIVRAVKSVKHLRKNVNRFTTRPHGAVTGLYDGLRAEIARIVVALRDLATAAPEAHGAAWLERQRTRIEEDARETRRRIDALIRRGELAPDAATSFLNDSGYAHDAMRELIEAARRYHVEPPDAMADVERLLELDEEDVIGTDEGRGTMSSRDRAQTRDRDRPAS